MSNLAILNSTDKHQLISGWQDGPDGRGTFDIIWSSFFTIFVCTFTVLHLNLPAPTDTARQILLRKIKWMVFAIALPELVTASAFAQRVAARTSVQEMSGMHQLRPIGKTKEKGRLTHWSMRHAFYWNMGGVRIKLKDQESAFPIDAKLQTILVWHDIIQLPNITEREIWDKSKKDRFAKVLACGQIGWLSMQCVARAIQGLPMSLLEVATVGFALPSLVTFALWFNKPNDIETPTVIALDFSMAEIIEKLGDLYNPGAEVRDTPLDCVKPINKPSATSEVVLKVSWWPCRTRFLDPADRIRNDIFALKYTILDQLIVSSVWLGYGAVHFAAWNFTFPTQVEKYMYRASVSLMMGSMFATWVFGNRKFYLIFSCLSGRLRKACRRVSDERKQVSTVQILLGAAAGLAYFVARLCIIAEVLASLRALPEGAFETIKWTKFVPHV